MNVHYKQLTFGFDDSVNAANEGAYNLGVTYSIGKLKRHFPSGISALSAAEVKKIMATETAVCGRLNSLYKGVFGEVLHRCTSLGVEYIGLRMIDTESIPIDGCPMTLEMTFSPQGCLVDQPVHFQMILESVKSELYDVCAELNDGYSAILSVLDGQESGEERHPINIVVEDDELVWNEDNVRVKSQNIAEYLERSLREKTLATESVLVIDDVALSIEPPAALYQAMADDPVPEREAREVKDVYVRSAFGEANGEYYMKIDGAIVGRAANSVEAQIAPHVFSGAMRNAAGRVNVRYLYQLNEKIVDLAYVRCKRRVTRPHLASKHEIILDIRNFRKMHEMRQCKMFGSTLSLDTIVAERNRLI
jgi:hypothetical protein